MLCVCGMLPVSQQPGESPGRGDRAHLPYLHLACGWLFGHTVDERAWGLFITYPSEG